MIVEPFGFKVRNIFGIGRNYADHAKELGNAVPVDPVVFLKPTSSFGQRLDGIRLPPEVGRVDPEVELVLAIGRPGKNLSLEQAWSVVAGVAVGLDMTARDLQSQAKKKGEPWALCKGFDTFAPVSRFVPLEKAGQGPYELQLLVNGTVRQKGSTADMIFSVPEILVYLSRHFSLDEGDLIFTGTPAGVAPICVGDRLNATLNNGAAQLELRVTDELS